MLCMLILLWVVGLPTSSAYDDLNSSNHEIIGWQAEPSRRGTWSILWGCITTLLLCVNTAIHLHLPHRTGTWNLILRQISWIAVGLLIPEAVVIVAWHQWRYARHLTAKLKDLREERKTRGLPVPDYMSKWTNVHSFFIDMGGVVINRGGSSRENRAFLTADGLVQLVREEQDPVLSVLTKDAINDRSKADFIAKTITVFQVFHTVILVIVRLRAHQSVSALEVFTCSHVVLAMMLMAFWWYKPYKVQEPMVLTLQNSRLNQDQEGHYDNTKHSVKPHVNKIVYTTTKPVWFGIGGGIGHATIDNNYPKWSMSMMCFGSTVVTALHLSLWNAYFPSPIEHWMWRVASIIIAAGGIAFGLFSLTVLLIKDDNVEKQEMELPQSTSRSSATATNSEERTSLLSDALYAIPYVLVSLLLWILPFEDNDIPRWFTWARDRLYAAIYLAARTYILVECFAALRSLPADVYIVPTWTSIWPAFG